MLSYKQRSLSDRAVWSGPSLFVDIIYIAVSNEDPDHTA